MGGTGKMIHRRQVVKTRSADAPLLEVDKREDSSFYVFLQLANDALPGSVAVRVVQKGASVS